MEQLRTRMTVSEAVPPEAADTALQVILRRRASGNDRVHSFSFGTDPQSLNYWGFNGYLIARGLCIVHVGPLGYDN